MTLAPLHAAPVLVERTYDALLEAIVSGALEPGARYTQDELAERLGVSRQPVLQALLLLRRDGLVHDEPGRRGVRVVAPTAAFVQHLYGVRAALDALAARSAAHRPRPELREPGAAVIRRGRAAAVAGDVAATVAADAAFWRLLYEAAHNPVLLETVRPHWQHGRRLLLAALRSPAAARALWTEHHALLAAIVRGDARLAERLAREHCDAGLHRTLQHLFTHGGTHPTAESLTRRRR
jgi:DNA-binding GntR family transcriptional regulator